ncbi:hypothetical protein KR067_000377, partial [Drosophila pandora]
SQMCRVCRAESDCQVDIFAPSETALVPEHKPEPCLAQMLMLCSGCEVTRSDGMPQFVCIDCAAATRNAHRLRRQYQDSHMYFTEALRIRKDFDIAMKDLDDFNWKLEDNNDALMIPKQEVAAPDPEDLGSPYAGSPEATSGFESYSLSNPEFSIGTSHSDDSRRFQTRALRKRKTPIDDQKQFAKKKQLTLTQKETKEKRPQMYQCKSCPRSYEYKCSLEIHERTHNGDRPYKCHLCPKAFKQLGHLKTHNLLHTKELPFKCSLCNKKCRQKIELKKHMAFH